MEERGLRHALQVREDGEEAVLGPLVHLDGPFQVIEERRLTDAPLARDHEAIVVQNVQYAGKQALAAEEHGLVENGRTRDVGVEAAAERAPLAHPLEHDPAADQAQGGGESRGQEPGLLVQAAMAGDAERLLAAKGVAVGWLACAIGNNRAARFYEKNGWRRMGTIINQADTERGPFPLEVWRYEKPLTSGQPTRAG